MTADKANSYTIVIYTSLYHICCPFNGIKRVRYNLYVSQEGILSEIWILNIIATSQVNIIKLSCDASD